MMEVVKHIKTPAVAAIVRAHRPVFPDGLVPDPSGLIGLGGPLNPGILIEAYSKGIFPWSGDDPIPWYSPDPRLVLEPQAFRASRSLRKLARQQRYEIRYDKAFEGVMWGCATIPRPGQEGTWINRRMIRVYGDLFALGVAHCVEVYEGQQLVGGLYGLTLGRAFFGESMFSLVPNASKLALYSLCENLAARDFHFVDCQQVTRHLMSLGALPIPRATFLRRLRTALAYDSLHEPWTGWAVFP